MNCKELRNNVRGLAGNGADDRRRTEAQAHMAACQACAAAFEAERQLTMAFGELAGSHAEERPTDQVEVALQAAFRARAAEQTVPTRAVFPWRWAAIAVGVAVVFAVFYAVAHRAPQRTVKNEVIPQMPQVQPAAVEPQPVTAANTPQKTKPVRRRVRPKAAEPLRVVTAFYQVPYAEPLRPEESKRIVRVRVPRSTLVQFGFAVAEERAQEPISADVLVGDDNLARAIRLVGDWRPRSTTRSARPVNFMR